MIASERGYPTQVRVDNGPEFISHHMAGWAWRHAVRIHYIQPGKPAQNGFVERFNRTYRLDEVRRITFEWLEEYNSIRIWGLDSFISIAPEIREGDSNFQISFFN